MGPKDELLRIALAASPGAGRHGVAVPDRAGSMPGRGAYICRGSHAQAPGGADQACMRLAMRRGAIPRALRATVTLAPELVESGSP